MLFFPSSRPIRQEHGFTLEEVIISIAITGISISATVSGYYYSSLRIEWSAHSMAAQSQVLRRMEQVQAAQWNPSANSPVDELTNTNFPTVIGPLELPVVATNTVSSTLVTSIQSISSNPPLKMIKVECSWEFLNGNTYTNSLVSLRNPDQ
jgi:prepilin-type N-terminal cleavage/methylation domain-containing protein